MDAGAPLVGREAELDWLIGWAYRSRTRALLVRGEPGIGKTRLVSELIARARLRRTPRVLVGRSAALASESLPFAALTEILRGLLEQYDASGRQALVGAGRSVLAHLLPELSTQPAQLSGPAEPLQLFEAVRDLLQRYSEARPVLVVVEDVQWMSGSGVELLGYLLRADLGHVRFVLTARDADGPATELARLVTEGIRARLLDVLALAPLSLLAVQQLTTALLGRPPPLDLVERVHRLSGGNPFFVEELTRSGGCRALGCWPSCCRSRSDSCPTAHGSSCRHSPRPPPPSRTRCCWRSPTFRRSSSRLLCVRCWSAGWSR